MVNMRKFNKINTLMLLLVIFGTTISVTNIQGSETFTGYVKDKSNNAISGAAVIIADRYGSILGFTTTSSSGYYSFYVTLNGNSPYYLSASHTDFEADTKTVASGGSNNFALRMCYSGYILDRNNDIISSASVKLYNSGDTSLGDDTTSSSGFYEIVVDYLANGYLKVEKTKWDTQTQSVTSGGTYNINLYTSACALIVAGSSDKNFNHDAHLMYNTLLDHYSYSADRVFLITDLLSYDDITIPRDSPASQSNVEDACDDVSSLTSTNDDVFVAWFSHGFDQEIECGSDTVTRTELDDALDDITCDNMIVMIESCYSGSFIGGGMDDESNRAILTSSDSDELSWGFEEYADGTAGHGYFGYGIICAIDPDLNADDADNNNNNRVSVDEFFDFAYDVVKDEDPFWYKWRRYYQNPQIHVGTGFSDTNTYLGDQYY